MRTGHVIWPTVVAVPLTIFVLAAAGDGEELLVRKNGAKYVGFTTTPGRFLTCNKTEIDLIKGADEIQPTQKTCAVDGPVNPKGRYGSPKYREADPAITGGVKMREQR